MYDGGGKILVHNFSLHGVGFKSVEMYFCTTI